MYDKFLKFQQISWQKGVLSNKLSYKQLYVTNSLTEGVSLTLIPHFLSFPLQNSPKSRFTALKKLLPIKNNFQ